MEHEENKFSSIKNNIIIFAFNVQSGMGVKRHLAKKWIKKLLSLFTNNNRTKKQFLRKKDRKKYCSNPY